MNMMCMTSDLNIYCSIITENMDNQRKTPLIMEYPSVKSCIKKGKL